MDVNRAKNVGISNVGMASPHLSSVPIIDVDRTNMEDVWPRLKEDIDGAEFVALDCVRL